MFPPRLSILATLVAFAAAHATAQCDPVWVEGAPLRQLRGNVSRTITWDPDGAGPMPLCLVAVGLFAAGTIASTSVALWTGSEWLPTNPPQQVSGISGITVWNGHLVVCTGWGWVYEYDGTTWTQIGQAWDGPPQNPGPGELRGVISYNGDLFAFGNFNAMDWPMGLGNIADIARWDGTSWTALGTGPGSGNARCAAVFNNSLFVGGYFNPGGAFPAPTDTPNLRVWNGTTWASAGLWNGPIDSLAARIGTALTNSFLYAGGSFTAVNTTTAAPGVARFSPSSNSWTGIAAPPTATAPETCTQMFVRATGLSSFEVAAVFRFASSGDEVWRLNGTTWSNPGLVGDPVPFLRAHVGFWAGTWALGLNSGSSSTPPQAALRTYDAGTSTWPPILGAGFDDAVLAVCADGSESVVAGRFTTYGTTPMARIARGHDATWQPLGAGFTGGDVFAVVRMPNGDIVAGGDFTAAGGAPANRVARWNGSVWAPLGAGLNDHVAALLALPNGDLVAAGAFTVAGSSASNRIARWNGTSWAPLGTGANGDVNALTVRPDGSVVAGGDFTTIGGVAATNVASWNGSAWAPLGSGVNASVIAVSASPEGDVWVGGTFTMAGSVVTSRLARWDGAQWNAVTDPFPTASVVRALAALPRTEVAVALETSWLGSCFARLRGSTWETAVYGAKANAIARRDDGSLVVGGDFLSAGDFGAGNVARIEPTCPAIATVRGFGCAGSAGVNVLSAETLPWDGTHFRSRATGVPATCFGFSLFGFVQALLQLDLLLGEALPGCLLFTTPDLLFLSFTTTGVLETDVFLAPTPSLLGLTIHHQMLPIELDVSGAISAISATNALDLTIGTL